MLNSIKLGETIISWEKTLISEEISNLKLIKDDNELNKTVFDLQFQRVINNDCERTRVKERPLVKNFERDLELFITFYCKKYDIKYKQGMNEIIGPFILIKSLANISSHRIFNLFSVFINKFLTNYYHEEEFFSLKSSLGILKLLIKYHEPAISNSFDHGVITPEMYATSWILTIFANKTKIDILLLLWNIVIVENDELFVHFLVVGFLMKNKDVIIKCDYSQIPILISTLSITSKEDVISIYNNAIKIRDTTPHSFRIFARNLYIFSRADINHLKLYFEYYRPDKLFTLPILPSELIYITYNSTIECPDENCEKYQRKYEKLIHSKEFEIAYPTKTSFFPCYFCKRKKGSKQENSSSISPKSFVFLDFRLEENCICGYLPGTLILDKKDFEDPNFGEKLTERFSYEKGKYHFVMITSETENFFKYEEKFYQENKEETHKKEFIPTKVSRIICEKEINKIKGSVEIENKLKEYDTFKKIIKIFTRKNFPYISFILGGFKDIHNAKVPLLSHDIKLCYLCKKINKKNERRKYSFSKRDSLIKENNDNRKSMILTSKTINQFSISRQTSISPLFLDPHSNNYTLIKTNYSIDDVAEILNNSKIRVFECLLLDYKNLVVNCNNSSKQVLIFLCREDVKILKLEEDIFDENKYSLIEKIFPKNVLFVKRKKDQKNAVELSFISYLHEKMSIFLELSNDIESKYFISLLREYFDSIKSI